MKEKKGQTEALEKLVSKSEPPVDREFLVPHADKQGHSRVIWTRITPSMGRQADVFVQSGVLPYKTVSELVRHAILRHLTWLEHEAPEVSSIMAKIRVAVQIMQDAALDAEFDKCLLDLRERVGEYQRNGEQPMAEMIVLKVWGEIKEMPEEQRGLVYKARFKREFYHLMPRMPVHPLEDLADEEES